MDELLAEEHARGEEVLPLLCVVRRLVRAVIRFVRVKRWRWHKIVGESIARSRYCDRVKDEAKIRRRQEYYERCRIEFIAAYDRVAKRDEA